MDMLGGVIGAFGYGQDAKTSTGTPITTIADKKFADALVEAQRQNKRQAMTVETTSKTAGKKCEAFEQNISAVEQFMSYQDMTPAEKFRASYLAEKGLTEDDLAKMTPEDRAKVEEAITERIREKTAQSVARKVSRPED